MQPVLDLFYTHPLLFALASSLCALGLLVWAWLVPADEVEERPDLHIVGKDGR
jgi:hypothetical protein